MPNQCPTHEGYLAGPAPSTDGSLDSALTGDAMPAGLFFGTGHTCASMIGCDIIREDRRHTYGKEETEGAEREGPAFQQPSSIICAWPVGS